MDSVQYLQNLLGSKRHYQLLRAYADGLYQGDSKDDQLYTTQHNSYPDTDRSDSCVVKNVSCDIFDDTFMGKVYSSHWHERTYAATQIGKVVKQMESLESVSSSLDRILGTLALLNQDTNSKVMSATLHAYESLLNFLKDKDLNRYLRPLVTSLIVHVDRDEPIGSQKAIKAIHKMLAQVHPMNLLRILVEDWKLKRSKVRVEIMNRVIACLLCHPKSRYDVKFLIKVCIAGFSDKNELVRQSSFECLLVLLTLTSRDQQRLLAYVVKHYPMAESQGIATKIRKRLQDKQFAKCDEDGTVRFCPNVTIKGFKRDIDIKTMDTPKEGGEESLFNEAIEIEASKEDVVRFEMTKEDSTMFSSHGDTMSSALTSHDSLRFSQTMASAIVPVVNVVSAGGQVSADTGIFKVESEIVVQSPVSKRESEAEIFMTPMKGSPKRELSNSELSVCSNGTYTASPEKSKLDEIMQKSFNENSGLFAKKKLLSVLERWENAYTGAESLELEPLLNPHQTIEATFSILCEPFDSQKDWYKRKEAIGNLFRIAKHHTHILFEHRRLALITVCHHVRKVPIVARVALKTLREIIAVLGCFKMQEAELVMTTLLDEYGVTQYKNMKEDIIFTLTNVISKISYHNAALLLTSIRKHTKSKASAELEAKLLRSVVVQLGPVNSLVDENNLAANILITTGVFIKSANPVTRYYARHIVQILMTSLEFEKRLRRHLPGQLSVDIRNAANDIKKKGLGRSPQENQKQIRKTKVKKGSNLYALRSS